LKKQIKFIEQISNASASSKCSQTAVKTILTKFSVNNE
jgi:hypothetical protein